MYVQVSDTLMNHKRTLLYKNWSICSNEMVPVEADIQVDSLRMNSTKKEGRHSLKGGPGEVQGDTGAVAVDLLLLGASRGETRVRVITRVRVDDISFHDKLEVVEVEPGFRFSFELDYKSRQTSNI